MKKWVLVVEDDPFANKAICRICKMKGWEAKPAMTIKDAMVALDDSPTCVVLDLMLPDGNGGDGTERNPNAPYQLFGLRSDRKSRPFEA